MDKSNTLKKEEEAFITDTNDTCNKVMDTSFGWGKFRPSCLRFLSNPKWFLLGIVLYTVCQGVTIMGLTTVTLPSIEKRFSLTGKEMGAIAAANDVSALVLVIFISFYGDYGNKIKWIGGGGVLVGISSLLYALPHVLIGVYKPTISGTNNDICLSSDNPSECNEQSEYRWYYLLIFTLAQIILGAGISPFYSLVPAYLDENVHPKMFPVFLGIWQCAIFIGPGAGMALGGRLLSIYVDITQPAGARLETSDAEWIGAWWLGFVIFGVLIIVASLFVLGFPRELPGAKKIREEQIQKGNIKKVQNTKKPSLKQIVPELKNLLKNWTFLFNSLGVTATLLYIGALIPFLTKIFQMKFGLSAEISGYSMAIISTPGMIVGIAIGSFIVKKLSLKNICKNCALIIFIVRVLGVVGSLAFLIPGCNNVVLAGMDTSYNNQLVGNLKITEQRTSLARSCNQACQCSLSSFSPVCGSDNVTYFDACHAGCQDSLNVKVYSNCSCIASFNQRGAATAERGYCDRGCKNFAFFALLISINTILQFIRMVPDKTVLLRCVPDNKRAFATGIQYVLMKTLGLLPGPIVFGHVIDKYCVLWQDTCGKRGRCFVYDQEQLSIAILIFGLIIAVVSSVFYFFSWYLYKTDETGETQSLGVEKEPENTETTL